MADVEFDVTSFLGVFALSLGLCYIIYNWIKTWNYPPGPYGLPLIGFIPFLGKKPNITLRDLSKKYGDIFSFYIGPKLVICITDFDFAKEILNHPMTLAKQPNSFDFLVGKGGFIGMNGEEWQEQRRFAVQNMRDLGLGKGVWETMIQENVGEFITLIKKADGQPVIFADPLALSHIKNGVSLLFGRQLDLQADKDDIMTIREFGKAVIEHSSSVDINITLPWINKVVEFFNLFGYKDFIALLRKLEAIFKNEVNRRMQSKEELIKDDFIGCYLKEMEKRKNDPQPHSFTVEHLQGNLLILFLAGQDSTNAAVSWLLLLMAKYPNVQKKVCEEIDDVIGRDGVVSYNDRVKLPFTMATILEMMRWISINSLFAPRYVLESFTFKGYTIPQGANIICNNWAISHDRRYFEDPMTFLPERFLTDNGTKVAKLKGYAPFSFGKRNCPGEGVAMMSMYLYFVSIMQKYTIRTPDGNPPDMEYKFSAGAIPNPQKLCFIQR